MLYNPILEKDDIVKAMQVLGIKTSDEIVEIKKAYRRLAKKCHPDISPSSGDYKRFIILQEAYNTLLTNLNNTNVSGVFFESYPDKEDKKGFQSFSFENFSTHDFPSSACSEFIIKKFN